MKVIWDLSKRISLTKKDDINQDYIHWLSVLYQLFKKIQHTCPGNHIADAQKTKENYHFHFLVEV